MQKQPIKGKGNNGYGETKSEIMAGNSNRETCLNCDHQFIKYVEQKMKNLFLDFIVTLEKFNFCPIS